MDHNRHTNEYQSHSYSLGSTQYPYYTTPVSTVRLSTNIFDERQRPSRQTRTNRRFLPPLHLSSMHDERIATANAIRERLLTDIQRNIREIDRELTHIERQTSMTRFSSSRFTLNETLQQIPIEKPRKFYEVIPRIPSERHLTPKLPDLFTGKYHYGPEIDETEIHDNDPENVELKSIAQDIQQFNRHETFSLSQFLREQSELTENRALIHVPQYVDNSEYANIETTEDFHDENIISDTELARTLTSNSLQELSSSDALDIQDFQLLIQTAPVQNELNPPNSLLNKPVKHAHVSTKVEETLVPTQQTTSTSSEDNINVDSTYFFSDFGNEIEGEEDLISIDPENFSIPAHNEFFDDNNNKKQRINKGKNNENLKQTESKKIESTKNDIGNLISTLTLEKGNDQMATPTDDLTIPVVRNSTEIHEIRSRLSSSPRVRTRSRQDSISLIDERSLFITESQQQPKVDTEITSEHWRERIDAILSKKRYPPDKYAHIKSRVDSFANFDYNRKISQNLSDKKSKKKKSKVKSFGRDKSNSNGTRKVFHQSLKWNVESKLKSYSLENLHYKPPKSAVKIFNEKPVWYSESKLADLVKRTQLKAFDINSNNIENAIDQPLAQTKLSERFTFNEKRFWPKKSKIQTFYEPLHFDSDSKTHLFHWSQIQNQPITKKYALFAQYYEPEWNDINKEPNLDESPANRPKWNSVSKTQSLNSLYNPKLANSNLIRKGWDLELRRKRVHKLPPVKQNTPKSNDQLAIEYHHSDRSPISHDYATISSRHSSTRILPPIQHSNEFHVWNEKLNLNNITPRSQRPIQQEWYDETATNRTGRSTRSTFREPMDPRNTPKELFTLRSLTRNSQSSLMTANALLDTNIRTNRATELRLSRDMEEHHRHCHEPVQSMPIEIRGFQLEGTQLTVPDHATIRPLSNINYQASERVKHHRSYPWSNMHPNPYHAVSRTNSLMPIAEFRPPSLESSMKEIPTSIIEEP